MALYSVYEPDEPAADLVERADSLVFVKDGFSWPALFVAPLWLIYHRMWLVLVLYLGGFVVLDLLLSMSNVGTAISDWAGFGYMIFFALEANGLRRYSLERKGYQLVRMVIGGNRERAEAAFFSDWLPDQRRAGVVSIRASQPRPGKLALRERPRRR
ncbi:hypothetical protein A7A08_01215 [Methyloligella halotolerans]|uniref:DUF2628 domain-containing protein n=1 Tax=Methyloligella halotolerans TaxID=1177755 RepID=A0A1E2S147_9HYPH|nr:DUF2628 domain-containing protein [Methyloligella halotolerans]ODA68045.1 hypothetical protein A7A08_01215 [Methyloligella halotolerans]